MLSVHEVMTLRPVTVTRHATIGELMGEFDRHDFNVLPVVDPGGVLVGIVSKLDVLRALRPAPDLDLRSVQAVADATLTTAKSMGFLNVNLRKLCLVFSKSLGT